jgi:hypothetical protein
MIPKKPTTMDAEYPQHPDGRSSCGIVWYETALQSDL